MTMIEGWEIDLKVLYGKTWKDRDKFGLIEDVWESPDGRMAGVLYGIAEFDIYKEAGRLAIFENKEKPELIIHIPKLHFWRLHKSGVQFCGGGVAFVHQVIKASGRYEAGILAVDIEKKSTCLVSQLKSDFYLVRRIEGKKYGFEKMTPDSRAEEIVIDLDSLPWKPIAGKFSLFGM